MSNQTTKQLLEIGFQFGQELLRNDEAEAVYVIGSQLNQQTHPGSDLDLVVKGLDSEQYFKTFSRGARKFPKDMDSLDLIPQEEADDYIRKQVETMSAEIKEDQTLDEFLDTVATISKKAG